MMPNAVRVLQAFVLDDPRSRLLDAIENGPERPRPRVDDRVFDPRLVLDRVGSSHPVALDDVDLGAVEVAGAVQPRLIGQRDDVGDQRVSVPPVPRVTHPPVGVVEVRPRVGVEHAKGVILLVDNREVARALKNLQRRRQVGRARNAGLIALDRRIGGRSRSVVLLSLSRAPPACTESSRPADRR